MNYDSLTEREKRGSRLRCIRFTDGKPSEVSQRLQKLVSPFGGTIGATDQRWMPYGPDRKDESKLKPEEGILPDHVDASELLCWWLKHTNNANVPNWDIAARCQIAGSDGLLLVEAKAHTGELNNSGKTRPSASEESDNSRQNRARIAGAIAEASEALDMIREGFNLSIKSHYQLSNRFAWAWKLASMGVPVILVYLGFLNANDMAEAGYEVLKTADQWERALRDHAKGLVPDSVWGDTLHVGETPLSVSIRSW